jgi:hypothetical protein
MVMDNHVAEAAGLQNGRNRLGIAPGQNLNLHQTQFAVGVAEKEDLVAIGSFDSPTHLLGGLGVYVLIHEVSIPLGERRYYRESAGKRKVLAGKDLARRAIDRAGRNDNLINSTLYFLFDLPLGEFYAEKTAVYP